MKLISKKTNKLVQEYEYVYDRFLEKDTIYLYNFDQSKYDRYSSDFIRQFKLNANLHRKRETVLP